MAHNVNFDVLYKRSGVRNPQRAVFRLAQTLVQHSGYTTPPYSPRMFAEIAKVAIAETDLVDCDARLFPFPTGYLAEICAWHPPTRQNFSLCHEIAHTFFLDPLALDSTGLSCSIFSPAGRYEERLCNLAASELLMPQIQFRRIVQDFNPSLASVRSISSLFGTSMQAVIRRICELDLWNCVYACLEPQDQEFLELGFRISWWGSSLSAFVGELSVRTAIGALAQACRTVAFLDQLVTYSDEKEHQAELSLKALRKKLRVQAYKYYKDRIPQIVCLLF